MAASLRPFSPVDLKAFPAFEALLGACPTPPVFGQAYTLLRDGVPVAIGGVIKKYTGTGEAWLWAEDAGRCFTLARQARRIIARCMADLALWRVEAVTADQRGREFLRHLGFTSEGWRRKAGLDGSDREAFALVVETADVG